MQRSLLALVAALVAVPALAPPAATAATATVQVRDFAFRPSYTRIEPGDDVIWIQGGSTTHTVTSRAGAPERFSAEVLPGQTFARVFPRAGRYAYHCTIHPEMKGVVQVGPDTTRPALTRVRVTQGARSIRVGFGLSESARVSAQVVAAARPKRVLRRARARQLDQGRRSVSLSAAGLDPGRYRVVVKAVDVARNVATHRATFTIRARR